MAWLNNTFKNYVINAGISWHQKILFRKIYISLKVYYKNWQLKDLYIKS